MPGRKSKHKKRARPFVTSLSTKDEGDKAVVDNTSAANVSKNLMLKSDDIGKFVSAEAPGASTQTCIGGNVATNVFPGATMRVDGDVQITKVTAPLQINIGKVNTAVIGDGNQIKDVTTGDTKIGDGAEGRLPLDEQQSLREIKQPDEEFGIAEREMTRVETQTDPNRNITENISAHTVNIQVNQFQAPVPNEDQPDVPIDKKDDFKSVIQQSQNFQKGPYILIAGRTESDVCLRTLSRVHWTAIFSFDVNSRSSGLLSVIEDILDQRRSLHILSWKDKMNVREESTLWIDLFGNSQVPDSITGEEYKLWNKEITPGLDTHIEKLASFSNKYVVLVIWPKTQKISHHIFRLLTKLEEKMSIKVILVCQGAEFSKEDLPVVEVMTGQMKCDPTIVHLTMPEMCKAVHCCLPEENKGNRHKLQLPAADKTLSEIPNNKAIWLEEVLEVFYDECPVDCVDITPNELRREQDTFYRGGTLPWYVWYEVGAGKMDVERDLMEKIVTAIRDNHIEVHQSGYIQLYHEPGSGGTTLAQRILWELKKLVPCAQVKPVSGITVRDIAQRLDYIYDKTRLPVVVLMDGDDQEHVSQLGGEILNIGCIILNVQRYTYTIKNDMPSSNTFCLRGEVSCREAKLLALQFEKQCQNKRKKAAVDKLYDDVRRGKKHSVFEFGLAAYTYEYKGIESYVRGFLQFDKQGSRELQNWQKSLGWLSLVYYYGQSSIPCSFFEGILQQEDLTASTFPSEMHELIVPGQENSVRISHYFIAKEILEQILPWPLARGTEYLPHLCTEAKTHLGPFATAFIELAEEMKDTFLSKKLSRIMTRTFICRDNIVVGDEGLSTPKQKLKFAPIMHDLDRKPPYTERFRVFNQLTQSFPLEAEYFAHFGRIYAICRPEEELKADECFNKALELCRSEAKGVQPAEYSGPLRTTLMRVNHMAGVMYSRRVAKFTGFHIWSRPTLTPGRGKEVQTAMTLLSFVSAACKHFQICREVSTTRHEKGCHYLNEITVRLQLCDFINRHCIPENAGLDWFMSNPSSERELAVFVQESLCEIRYLVIQHLAVVSADIPDTAMKECYHWYVSLFKPNRPHRPLSKHDTSVQSRRLWIAVRKLCYTKDKFEGLEYITNPNDLVGIVGQLESIFGSVKASPEVDDRRSLDFDYRDWIWGIRHPLMQKTYLLEDVHKVVEKWHERVNTPHSLLYHFVLKSLLGFGCSTGVVNNRLLTDVQALKRELIQQGSSLRKNSWPKEWFGVGENIRCLISGANYRFKIQGREITSSNVEELALVKGTIQRPNTKPACGYIDLDLGEGNRVTVSVFFKPSLCTEDLKGASCAGKRVEFILGFSLSHGYEAFNVRGLKKCSCRLCGLPVEVTSRDKEIICKKCSDKASCRQ